MGRQIHQFDRRSLICRNASAGRRIFAERIVEFHHALIEQFHQHFAGHQLGYRRDTDKGIQLRTNVISRSCFTEAAKHPLVTVDHDQRHSRRTAAVINKVRVAIGNVRGQNRGRQRLGCLGGGQAHRTQRGDREQTTFQRKASIK